MDVSLSYNKLFLLLFFCASLNLNFASTLGLDGNGYKGIIVSIHKNVPEDDNIINNIKTLISKASAFLYNSTNQGVYFKEVTIVVPSTWSLRPEYEILPGNFFSKAHVRVDNANPEYGDAPYTLQPGGCGEPGHYVHLTPWFVKELDGKTKEMFGAPERQLVHEWAHLRYGVFDEYGIPGDKRYPMFYQENGRIRPTSCIRDIKGWIEARDGGPCSMTPEGEVNSDCIFIPNMHSNEAKASIMYMPFIPSMEGFCDDVTHKHNMKAPTKHNAACNYRSTWDVISQHEDFQTLRVKRDANELTETLFRLIQSPKVSTSRYVLVLDVSGSMDGQPMKLLHSAATRLVEDKFPDGSYLGIVQFSSEAKILHNLTKVDNVTRMQLSQSLPAKDDRGLTAIGKGLQAAISVLKNQNGQPEAGLIMLITDGEENLTPFIEDVLPEILEHKVIINAVAFGPEASFKLENVTMATGGRGYFFPHMNGSRPASALDSAFLESVTSQADVELQPVQLKDEMVGLHESITKRTVYIDDDLGKNTIFTFTCPHIKRLEKVTLTSPSGITYNELSSEYNRDDDIRRRIQVAFPEAETGKWEIDVHRKADYPIIVGIAITSEPKDGRHQPIRVRSWLSEIQLKFPAYAKIYAEVKKGYRAVVGANVLATVERPMGDSLDVELKDDGIGADATENDGIYTAYFTHFNGNGRYAVMARVSNDGQAQLKMGSKASASQSMPQRKGRSQDVQPLFEFLPEFFLPMNETDEEVVETEPASTFDRSSNSGAFRLEAWEKDAGDVIPPGNVLDLLVMSTKSIPGNAAEVTLQWTTPGDDLDVGQVSSLELRASKDMEELLNDFGNGININETFLVNGTLLPELPGHKQNITLFIPDSLQGSKVHPWTVYFAIKATDDANSSSEKYNIAAANFGMQFNTERTLETTTTAEDESTENPIVNEDSGEEILPNGQAVENDSKNTSFKWWPIAAGIGAVIITIVFIVFLAVIVKKTRMKKYFSVQKEQC